MYIWSFQIEDLEEKMKEIEEERKKEKEAFEKEREGFVNPGKCLYCVFVIINICLLNCPNCLLISYKVKTVLQSASFFVLSA